MDASDPRTVAAFWSPLLGLEAEPAGDGVTRVHGDSPEWHVLADPQGNEFCVFTSS